MKYKDVTTNVRIQLREFSNNWWGDYTDYDLYERDDIIPEADYCDPPIDKLKETIVTNVNSVIDYYAKKGYKFRKFDNGGGWQTHRSRTTDKEYYAWFDLFMVDAAGNEVEIFMQVYVYFWDF